MLVLWLLLMTVALTLCECLQVDQGAVHTCHVPGGEVSDLYRWDRQHLSAEEQQGGGAHAAGQDGTAAADGGCGQCWHCGPHLPPLCHQLSLGAGHSLPTSLPEEDIHSTAWQVQWCGACRVNCFHLCAGFWILLRLELVQDVTIDRIWCYR